MIYKKPEELLFEIRHIMLLKNISINELALRMNTTQSNISNIFRNKNPKLETLFKICEALEIELDCEFISKNNNQNDDN